MSGSDGEANANACTNAYANAYANANTLKRKMRGPYYFMASLELRQADFFMPHRRKISPIPKTKGFFWLAVRNDGDPSSLIRAK